MDEASDGHAVPETERITRSEDVFWRRVGDEVLVLPADDGADGEVVAITRSEDVLWRRVGDEVLVLPVHDDADGEVVAITGSSSVLWEVLAEPVTVREAVSSLSEIYGVEAWEIERDVRPVLADLQSRGLVREVTS